MSKRKKAWFVKVRGSYLPSHGFGYLIYTLYLVFLATLLASWFRSSHKIWWLLLVVSPLTAIAVILTQYIASKHSK